MHQGPETWPRKGGSMNNMDRIKDLAARLAGVMAELEPYGEIPAAAEYAESLKEGPLNTVDTLLDILEGLTA